MRPANVAVKDRLLAVNKNVRWMPEHLRDGRFGSSLLSSRATAGLSCGFASLACVLRRVSAFLVVFFAAFFTAFLAVFFAAFFAAVLLVVKVVQNYTDGAGGLYGLSALAGLTDVDAITLSLAELSRNTSDLDHNTAARGIVLAAVSNTLVKGGIVLGMGLRRMEY